MLTQVREIISDMVYPEGKAERRSLERYVNEDSLTGLPNRRAFDLAIETAERDPSVSIVFFDMNNFGQLNKTEGHAAGDRRLKLVADMLASSTDGVGRVFRYGGDEFVAMVPAWRVKQFVKDAEHRCGVYRTREGVVISVTGSYGKTLAEAESSLQVLKGQAKMRLAG